MIGGESLGLSMEAATLVGTVLVEAIVLYVGYGAIERVAGRTVVEKLSSE
ncbi:DUF7512 family protein [Salinilacihabitans rarus]|nr:hypothetical protein [Salinilacihabitans rarus]